MDEFDLVLEANTELEECALETDSTVIEPAPKQCEDVQTPWALGFEPPTEMERS